MIPVAYKSDLKKQTHLYKFLEMSRKVCDDGKLPEGATLQSDAVKKKEKCVITVLLTSSSHTGAMV